MQDVLDGVSIFATMKRTLHSSSRKKLFGRPKVRLILELRSLDRVAVRSGRDDFIPEESDRCRQH